jgi:hypothetical protein
MRNIEDFYERHEGRGSGYFLENGCSKNSSILCRDTKCRHDTANIGAILSNSGGGLFTLLSNAARERVATGMGKHKLEYTTLSVNWVHAIALTGTFWAPIVFSSSALQYGYEIAWPVIGALSFALIVGFVMLGYRSQ